MRQLLGDGAEGQESILWELSPRGYRSRFDWCWLAWKKFRLSGSPSLPTELLNTLHLPLRLCPSKKPRRPTLLSRSLRVKSENPTRPLRYSGPTSPGVHRAGVLHLDGVVACPAALTGVPASTSAGTTGDTAATRRSVQGLVRGRKTRRLVSRGGLRLWPSSKPSTFCHGQNRRPPFSRGYWR